jgi:uncharacterized membrane protein
MEDVLRELAQQLGIGIEVLWTALLKQAYIEGCFDAVIGSIVFFVVMFIFPKTLLYLLNQYDREAKKEYSSCESDICFIIFVVAFFSLIAIGLAITTIYGGVVALANPEYWALREILTLI